MFLVYVLDMCCLKLMVLSTLTVKLIWLVNRCQSLQRPEISSLALDLGLPYLIGLSVSQWRSWHTFSEKNQRA